MNAEKNCPVFSAESLPARCPSGRSLRPVPLAMAIPGWLYFWVRQLQCHQIFIVNLDFDSVIFWGLGIEIHIERVQTLQIGLKSRFEATKLILVPDIFIQVGPATLEHQTRASRRFLNMFSLDFTTNSTAIMFAHWRPLAAI